MFTATLCLPPTIFFLRGCEEGKEGGEEGDGRKRERERERGGGGGGEGKTLVYPPISSEFYFFQDVECVSFIKRELVRLKRKQA